MSDLLIVSATPFEIAPLCSQLGIDPGTEPGVFSSPVRKNTAVLITGAGMVNTAFWMGRLAETHYRYVINAGICGAFDRSLELGEPVNITEDTLSELGAQDDEKFLRLEELNLGGTSVYHSKPGNTFVLENLKKVKAITVNTVHGNEKAIARALELFSPQVESMEGAAFFRGCKNIHENYIQLRAISNYVEKRDRSKWQIPLAIQNLNDCLLKLIATLP